MSKGAFGFRPAWLTEHDTGSNPAESCHPSAETEALVQTLAGKPPVAVRLGKAAFHAAMESSLAAGLEAMQAQLSLLNTTQDASEGVRAFLEKRKPEWTGR